MVKIVVEYKCNWCGEKFLSGKKKRWEHKTCPKCGWEDCKEIIIYSNTY